jgi:hypothetical protein
VVPVGSRSDLAAARTQAAGRLGRVRDQLRTVLGA